MPSADGRGKERENTYEAITSARRDNSPGKCLTYVPCFDVFALGNPQNPQLTTVIYPVFISHTVHCASFDLNLNLGLGCTFAT